MWHYLPPRWNGEEAARTYRTAIRKTLLKHRGSKRQYHVIEDNDPTGYKSRKACDAKKELKIVAAHFPRYSPDLNPQENVWKTAEEDGED